MSDKENTPSPEEVPCFDLLFSAQRPSKRIPFKVGEKDGFIVLRQMDSEAALQMATVGRTFRVSNDGSPESTQVDLAQQYGFLISRTMVDYLLWQTNGAGEPQEVRPPESAKQRVLFTENLLKTTDPKFFGWLLNQCQEMNGLAEPAQGNSGE